MKVMLVYQGGIANVFKVKSFNLAVFGRGAERMLQSDFRTCEGYARGMAAAGAMVRTAACNMAGDIQGQPWTDDLEAQLFSDKFHPVNPDKAFSRIIEDRVWLDSVEAI